MAKTVSRKEFEELKKLVEGYGVDFQKFAQSSEEKRNELMRNGYSTFRARFPQVYGIPIETPLIMMGGVVKNPLVH